MRKMILIVIILITHYLWAGNTEVLLYKVPHKGHKITAQMLAIKDKKLLEMLHTAQGTMKNIIEDAAE